MSSVKLGLDRKKMSISYEIAYESCIAYERKHLARSSSSFLPPSPLREDFVKVADFNLTPMMNLKHLSSVG